MQEMMIDLVATGWFWIGVGLYVLGMYLAAPTAWGIFGAMIDDPISIPKVETSINRVALHVYWGAAVVLIVVALALRCIATIFQGLSRTGHVIAQAVGVEEMPSE